MDIRLKNKITSVFKLHGFTLRSDGVKFLLSLLRSISEDEHETWLEKILDVIQRQPLESSILDQSVLETSIQDCIQDVSTQKEDILTVYDAFTFPRCIYEPERQKLLIKGTQPSLFGNANTKAELFRERFILLQQRISRHELFAMTTPGLLSNEEKQKKFHLHPIEFLMGTTSKLGEIIVFGMLTQLKEGKYFLEDLTGAVELNLSETKFHTGLFTENCFVLAEGSYEDKVFHVSAIGLPPAESAKTTRSYFGNANFFGGPSQTNAKVSSHLKLAEQENQDAMIVFLSDVWLDQFKVIEKLEVLFAGYAEEPPTCFVLIGSFLSTPYGSQHNQTLKDCLKTLADMLLQHPTLVQTSRFIFVPGLQDPGLSRILPRPSIPSHLTEDFCKKIATAVFTTNPCRIQYCTQEIVVFRQDSINKICRNCIYFPTTGDIETHFVKTVVSQGHLCPLPLHIAPVFWSYDHCLRLYPLPDVLVCADKYDAFSITNTDCLVFNPGSFPRNNYGFKVYMPASKDVEDSQIKVDE